MGNFASSASRIAVGVTTSPGMSSFTSRSATLARVRRCWGRTTRIMASRQCLDFDGQHGGQVADDGVPRIAAVGGAVDLAAGGSEVDAALVELVDAHRIA